MWTCSCALFYVSILLSIEAQFQLPFSRNEGDVCGNIGTQVWTCQRESQCSILTRLATSGRRITCSTKGKSRVICCPRPSAALTKRVSISEQKCLEYQSAICKRDNRFIPGSSKEENNTSLFDSLPNEVEDSSHSTIKRNIDNETDYYDSDAETSPVVAIYGGNRAFPKEHPYAALIGYGNENSISWKCGGTLISEKFVLSAAHCITSGKRGPATWVRLGDLDYRDESDDARPQQFEIIERIVHDNYTDPLYYNDLVLFRLDRDVVFDEYVAPACLYSALDNPDGIATATGWGKNDAHKRTSHLMKVDLNFFSNEECKSKINNIENLPSGFDSKTMLCAGSNGRDRDTCEGDSGGPLVLADRGESCLARLVGITSYGISICGAITIPTSYVRVANFIPWIESIVWPNSVSST